MDTDELSPQPVPTPDEQSPQQTSAPNTPTPTAPHLLLGKIGEELAANWLMSQGYYILDRNWKSKYGYELDIIAQKDNCLHVFEVKTRSEQSAAYRDPATAIDSKRMSRMCRGASLYKKYHRYSWDYRIHAILIVYRSEQDYDLRFLPNLHEQQLAYSFIRNRYRR